MRPDPQTSALRELFVELLAYDEPNAHVSAMMSSLDIRYPVDCPQPSAGLLAADRELVTVSSPVRLFELQRDGRAILVDRTESGELAAPAEPWADRVRLVRAGAAGAESLLIRPDGIVAWAVRPASRRTSTA